MQPNTFSLDSSSSNTKWYFLGGIVTGAIAVLIVTVILLMQVDNNKVADTANGTSSSTTSSVELTGTLFRSQKLENLEDFPFEARYPEGWEVSEEVTDGTYNILFKNAGYTLEVNQYIRPRSDRSLCVLDEDSTEFGAHHVGLFDYEVLNGVSGDYIYADGMSQKYFGISESTGNVEWGDSTNTYFEGMFFCAYRMGDEFGTELTVFGTIRLYIEGARNEALLEDALEIVKSLKKY